MIMTDPLLAQGLFYLNYIYIFPYYIRSLDQISDNSLKYR